jgi:hypothetical protein
MKDRDLENLKKWYDEYSGSYYSSDEEDQRNIQLKVDHTYNVCRNIVEIAEGESLNHNQLRIAETIALFHDLGRFPQYAQFKTFRDAISVSHGRLGAQTLAQGKILAALRDNERKVIMDAVKFHGAFAIPTVMNGDTVFYLKLIRDADKVDIFRVFIEYYESPADQRASATAFGVPDTEEYSESMLMSLCRKKIASYSQIKTENDFRIMKLSWLYDMNFNASIRLIQKRGYINRIINKLPQTDEIRTALTVLQEYVAERLSDDKKQ